MAVYKQDIVDIELNSGNVHRSFLKHAIGSADAKADHFGIRTFRGGVPVDLSGVSVQGYFRNSQGTNIAITSGNIVDGNVAEVVLPQACYNYEGPFCLAIKLIGDGVTGTMRIVDGVVDNTNTGSAVAPTGAVPTYSEILDTYAAMTAATAAANLAIAEEFDATKTYPAGKNVINSGALYLLPEGHTANTTWANTTKVASNLGDQVADLKNAIPSGIIYTSRMAKSGNLFPFREDVIDGKYYSISNGELTTQTNASYYGFILAVNPNTEYHCTFARFLCLLDANKTPIAEMQSSTTIINTGNAVFIAVSFDKTTYPIGTYAISLGDKSDITDYKIELPWLFSDANIYKMLPNGLSAEEENPAANSSLVVCDFSNNVKYRKTLVYEAHFTGTIGDITLYHGVGTYGSYVKVTSTNIVVNTSGTNIYNEPHNITTIADYMYIMLDTDDVNNIKVSVMSNGKRVEVTVSGWDGWQGQVFAISASALTYHRLTWTCKDLDCPIWVFGDSYLSKTSNERWGYYLKQWGFDNFLCAGYPGAASANVINTLKNIILITQPKYLIWALGMNDPDTSSAINTSWETNAEKVKQICDQYGITLIFSKIPNANGTGTLYNHSFKNAWIDASGCRFIDVPFAVGADTSGNWYTGLLANDGIHPSWRGAEAIAYQFIADVPELVEQT